MTKNTKLPKNFKPLMWGYKFNSIDAEEDKERIIINTINYGDWEHWQWLIKNYGKMKVKQIIENIPASEFRARALKLISLLLKIKKMKYASRGIKIKAESNLSRA